MEFKQHRRHMVDEQIHGRNIADPFVLNAMRRVERHKFVPAEFCDQAYSDQPLPIGSNQTISQPYIVALMIEALQLKGGEKVLEIGTGSGYAAAVLAEIAGNVVTVERVEELAKRARILLSELGYDNITVMTGDGTMGCAEHAPYDAIVVTAGGPDVPHCLRDQLKIGGRLVIPVGSAETFQVLFRITKTAREEYREESLCDVRFVPLVGEEGWHHELDEIRPNPDHRIIAAKKGFSDEK